ncbi:hypothetical protein [Mycolicibacterium goodii]|uniref:Uncharacterized protein n=1 Tax=Mycobacterium phage Rem711 TaxID=2079285 RepID=A0A2K9VET4_9CAUD|nr:hypothetical protein [Mycolicibacterium goodii]YP_009964045.1 hypothetical protein I5J35_gp20 [Mycobacterium phage Rem711]AUV60798.1 hypothetical protein SEA_REM711_20 [Mycobacterium phage Rem711]MBU8834565.1 hypothetical protein [Mycolicibacterium goodii]
MPADLIPASAFRTPPSNGGVRIRFWDRDFNLVADNAAGDVSAAQFLTVDEPAGRTAFRLEPLSSSAD